ncbi:STAS domain-containing protein [Streptomyces sp. NPDC006368]|uniref:STAS domain-containing protein n=1 Tax=Streptomyces sp. NPDC006368 TaxID=3156760 RepID=UPI0033AEA935
MSPPGSGADPASGALPAVVRSCRSHDDHTLFIEVQHEVDHYSAGPLRVMLTAAAAYGYHHIAVDSQRVTFADSAFLNALDSWQRDGRTVRITRLSPAVTRLLRATRITSPRRGWTTAEEAPM